jgi:hypothetical protein
MVNSGHDAEDRRLRRKTAAFRLKHDVGKAVRWSAPDTRESSPLELRKRLMRDLLSRASGGGANRDVVKIFFEWKREESPLFPNDDPDLETLERAMTTIARLAPRLSSFNESSSSLSSSEQVLLPDLLALDDACIEASRACTAFYRRVAVDEGPEIIRPIGARQ